MYSDVILLNACLDETEQTNSQVHISEDRPYRSLEKSLWRFLFEGKISSTTEPHMLPNPIPTTVSCTTNFWDRDYKMWCPTY